MNCTCHPLDNPPIPCAEAYAYQDCVAHSKTWRYRVRWLRFWISYLIWVKK